MPDAHLAPAEIVIVVPPFANVEWPSLGASALVAECARAGLTAHAHYENLHFAALVGSAAYAALSLSPSTSLVAEGILAAQAFPRGEADEAGRGRLIMDGLIGGFVIPGGDGVLASESLALPIAPAHVEGALAAAEAFLEGALSRILARAPRIVGFSSVFQQTTAAIAIARRLKAARPEIVTVLGGANATSPMGDEIASVSGVFDHVFSGEADEAFPAFARRILREGRRPAERVVACAPIADMDALAIPDYDDYFATVESLAPVLRPQEPLPHWVHFESSRGCWWGQKSHCTFCGLNATGMTHRAKSPERVLEEIARIEARHGVRRHHATDNILPLSYTRTVLPRLAEDGPQARKLFYEVKSNLRESELDLFVRAGLTMIQPGIESLSTRVLKLMRKGVSGPQNIALLRDCASRGIYVSWNVILGFPGETAEDYAEMLAALPALEHLQPPEGWGFVRFDRFSPYHMDAEAFGIDALAPFPSYAAIFPKGTDLAAVAYYFSGRYAAPLARADGVRGEIEGALSAWKTAHRATEAPRLDLVSIGPEAALVLDTRRHSRLPFAALDAADVALVRRLRRPTNPDSLSLDDRTRALAFVARSWVLQFEGLLVSIVREPEIGAALRRWAPAPDAVPMEAVAEG
ncbi:RiPP maturation radical SAM C-methyltransferase [Salinarimonas rosea]|uniref:RiPP maturation radical SAM C-methyltransferase n=1 Tax=Salinarimonas rosea TaxID=552063 RepID=UPI0004041B33|nr:RiPP maturation radical SAM C-methyltransferase [Salinarimonas rosea]